MIECPICHVNNDDQTHFCTECGHRFPAPNVATSPPQAALPPRPQIGVPDRPNITPVTSQSASSSFNSSNTPNPSPTPSSSTYMDNNNPNPSNQGNQEPPKRQRLHSPILGGDDPDDESYAQNNAPSNYGAPKAPKTKSGLLRSPLLGGGNVGFDEDEPQAPAARPPKGAKPQSKPAHLRSPLLGGSGDDEDDYEEDFPLRDKHDKHSDKTSFPHRRNTHIVDAPEPAPGSNTGSRPHLRSPLLQGDDEFEDGDNYNNHNYQNQAPAAPQGRQPAKLHSPLFDKQAGGSFGYDYDDDNNAPVNDNPNALRSPLLAARSPIHQDNQPRNPAPPAPAPAAPRPMVQPPAPPQPMVQAQPSPLAQPASLPQFPNPRPLSNQPPAIGTPLPMTPAIPPDLHDDEGVDHSWNNNSFASAAPLPAVNPMPGFTPGMPQPAAPLPEPTGYGAPLPAIKEPPKPAQAPTPAPVPKLEPKLKSKLLGGSADSSYDDDYDDDYKPAPPAGGRKRFGDDSHQSNNSYQPGHTGGGASSGPIMVLVAPMVLVAMGKAYFLYALGSQLIANPATAVDQIGQFIMILAVLVYGMMGNKR